MSPRPRDTRALGICLVLVAACSSESKPSAPAPPPPPAPPAAPVTPPASPPSEGIPDTGVLVDISADGTRALVANYADGIYRVVALDTNQVERELVVGESTSTPSDAQRAAAALIASFPRRATTTMSASPDGKSFAYVANDEERPWLVVARPGAATRLPLSELAVYAPDGKTLFVEHEIRSDGPHELQVVSAGGAPRAIPGTRGVVLEHVMTATELRVMLVPDPMGETCFAAVGWTPPHAVKRLGCVPGGERILHCHLSPSGTWAACSTMKDDKVLRTRTLNLATGAPGLDVTVQATSFAISDEGRLVTYDPFARQLLIHDPTGAPRTKVPHPHGGSEGMFRNLRELVVVQQGKLVVLDVTR